MEFSEQSRAMQTTWCGKSWLLTHSVIKSAHLVIKNGRGSFHHQVLFSASRKKRKASGGHDPSLQSHNPKPTRIASVQLLLSELSHMATPSCVSKSGK